MSAEVATQSNSSNNNMDENTTTTQQQQPSLETPSRESVTTNNTNQSGGGGGGGDAQQTADDHSGNNTKKEEMIQKIEETKRIKYSSLKSETNPLTMAREKALKEGRPLMVNFDERVVVHTVPYWDPCGETYNDTDDDGPRGPNCCIVL